MNIFYYDHTFDGILSALFDAYTLKVFPDLLLPGGAIAPLQATGSHDVASGPDKVSRVSKGLKKKLSAPARHRLMLVWLSEQPGSDWLLFRFMRKVFDSPSPLEDDITVPDVLELHQIARQVSREAEHLLGFARFQKTAQGCYFAALAPRFNTLPLLLRHFADRFADQPWIIYDLARHYGIFFKDGKFNEASLDERQLQDGKLPDALLAGDEKLFQQAWKDYCQSLVIPERLNRKLQRRLLPVRFWKYLTEMN